MSTLRNFFFGSRDHSSDNRSDNSSSSNGSAGEAVQEDGVVQAEHDGVAAAAAEYDGIARGEKTIAPDSEEHQHQHHTLPSLGAVHEEGVVQVAPVADAAAEYDGIAPAETAAGHEEHQQHTVPSMRSFKLLFTQPQINEIAGALDKYKAKANNKKGTRTPAKLTYTKTVAVVFGDKCQTCASIDPATYHAPPAEEDKVDRTLYNCPHPNEENAEWMQVHPNNVMETWVQELYAANQRANIQLSESQFVDVVSNWSKTKKIRTNASLFAVKCIQYNNPQHKNRRVSVVAPATIHRPPVYSGPRSGPSPNQQPFVNHDLFIPGTGLPFTAMNNQSPARSMHSHSSSLSAGSVGIDDLVSNLGPNDHVSAYDILKARVQDAAVDREKFETREGHMHGHMNGMREQNLGLTNIVERQNGTIQACAMDPANGPAIAQAFIDKQGVSLPSDNAKKRPSGKPPRSVSKSSKTLTTSTPASKTSTDSTPARKTHPTPPTPASKTRATPQETPLRNRIQFGTVVLVTSKQDKGTIGTVKEYAKGIYKVGYGDNVIGKRSSSLEVLNCNFCGCAVTGDIGDHYATSHLEDGYCYWCKECIGVGNINVDDNIGLHVL